MSVAVFIKSESMDNYLNVWDNPTKEDIINWIKDIDLPSYWEIASTNKEDYQWVRDIVSTVSEEMWEEY